jgi:hypothetical protein
MSNNTGFRHPAFVISIIIILGVFILIGAAIMGLDNGVLGNMANSNFARGLITYLFAVVTIGTAVVLIVSVLTTENTESNMERVDRGKDILSLLLGVFGTIIGFYFGSELNSEHKADANFNVTPLLLSQTLSSSNQELTLTAAVSAGEPPYLYRVAVGKEAELGSTNFVDANAWIVYHLQAPTVTENSIVPITVDVEDAHGKRLTRTVNLGVSP